MNKNFPEIELPGGCKGEMLKLQFERYIILCFGVLDVPLCDVIKLKFNLLSIFYLVDGARVRVALSEEGQCGQEIERCMEIMAEINNERQCITF